MQPPFARLRKSLLSWIWSEDYRSLHGARRALIASLRMGHALLFVLTGGQLSLLTMSLVYTSLLSIIPLMAVTFSVLKAFGVHHDALPLLTNFLSPLGEAGESLAEQLIGVVENLDTRLLGTLGLATLIYLVISLLHKIEGAINKVWQIQTPRRPGQRFSNYLSVILVGPVLIFGAIGITAIFTGTAMVRDVMAIRPFGALILWGSKLIPYLLVWGAFTFVYVFVPNVRVRMRAAIIGGLTAAVLWQTAGWAFASFIATSGRYARIYSGFSILILGLLWLHYNWLILLLGAQIAYFVQTPRRYLLHPPVPIQMSNQITERLALSVMFLIAKAHHRREAPWTLVALADHFDVPAQPVQRVLDLLGTEGWVLPTGDDPQGWLPARDASGILLTDLIASVRRAGGSYSAPRRDDPVPRVVDAVIARAERAVAGALGDLTLHDLVASEAVPAPPAAQGRVP